MKKFYLFVFNFFALIWLELSFGLIVFDSFQKTTIFAVFLFLIPLAIFNTIMLSIFNRKFNFIIGCILYSILGIGFSLQLVFKQVFDVFFQISLFALSDQVIAFGKETFISILSNVHYILLMFIPLILFIVFRKKLYLQSNNGLKHIIYLSVLLVTIGSFLLYTEIFAKETITYKLIYKLNDNSQSVEHLGVTHSSFLDMIKTFFKFEEEIIIVNPEPEKTDDLFEYDKNILEIDFSKGNNDVLNNYMSSDSGTYQNKYTGIFEGKNLIYIVAESFHSIGVSKELTPTLYSLINDGFMFENFYVPNNLSTIGGEFQALTGLYADRSVLSTWRTGKNYFPYGLSTMFKNAGYETYAYHNNSYTFQNRNNYLLSQGFTNFKGCWNGMEKLINCRIWPQSDIEMMNTTVGDYINSEKPFLAYYVTVSGHFGYTFNDNYIAYKNRSLVNHLNYSEEVKGYIATQIELDRALESLINKLKEKGVLEDTVIVLLADHYPYDLSEKQIAEVSTYNRDSQVELHHNNLIIWNSKLKQVNVEKVSMSIDVIPTVYNLFGIEYDSRLFVGRDIFSNSDGLAILNNRSWVTDKGTYYSSTNTFVPKVENISSDYVETMNQIVANRLNVSKMIISNNYYQSLFK